MIKIGCNFLSMPDLDLEIFLRTAFDLKLDVVDLNVRALAARDPAYLLSIKRLSLDLGLPLGYLGVSNDFVGSEAELERQIDMCKEAIDTAVFLGCPLIRVFGGHVPEGVQDREPLWEPLVRCMRAVATYGADRGIVVGLQNHDGKNMAATPEAVLRILSQTDHPNLCLIVDTAQWHGSIGAHPVGEADPQVDIYSYFEQTLPHAAYVRTKFYRIDSGAEEWLDYERICRLLTQAGYNGCLSIVYEGGSDPVQSVARAAAYLRKLLPSVLT